MIEYLKMAGVTLGLAAVFMAGFYFGGLRGEGKAAREAEKLATDHADMAQSATDALIAQQAHTASETNRLNGVIARYEQAPIDPIVSGIVHRVYVHEAAHDCAVSATATDSTGTSNTGAQPDTAGTIEQVAQQYATACSADAAQLNALIAAWPR